MRQPEPSRRGRLKVFLSYAAGAGKTYRMLEEAQEQVTGGRVVIVAEQLDRGFLKTRWARSRSLLADQLPPLGMVKPAKAPEGGLERLHRCDED